MQNIELLQGTLDMLILKVLNRGPLHGFGIAERIQRLSEDVFSVGEGSLYPALYRLEERGWIKSEWGQSENNRRAKYYTLSKSGKSNWRWRMKGGTGSAWRSATSCNRRRPGTSVTVEVKSMHTEQSYRRKGAASMRLRHLIGRARQMELSRLSLETGAQPYFGPARELYKRHEFVECPPFGSYVPDANSVFMTRELGPTPSA